MRIGGQESKWIGRVAFILRQMERDPSDRVPDRITAFQIRRRSAGSLSDGLADMGVEFIPYSRQDFAVQILESPSSAAPLRQGGPFRLRWFRDTDGCGVLRSGLWQSAVNSRWANPRQKTRLGGSGSCRNPDASISKPRAGAAANPSVKRATTAWLSFGSACSSGWTKRCPPGDNARACDMAQRRYQLSPAHSTSFSFLPPRIRC